MTTPTLDRQKAIYWLEQFIELAYNMYQPGVPNPPLWAPPTGWQIVKNVTVEAAVGFIKQKEFIGFVAQSTTDATQYAIAIHGTESVMDYLDDFEFVFTNFTLIKDSGQTEYGFTRLYESMEFVDPNTGTSESLTDYLNTLTPKDHMTVLGYSLGGALATLHAAVLSSRQVQVTVYTYGSPMVGNSTFANTYNQLIPTSSYRIYNVPDIVPTLPGTWLGYEHVHFGFSINTLDYPEIKRTISCFHSTNAYAYALGDTNYNLGSCHA